MRYVLAAQLMRMECVERWSSIVKTRLVIFIATCLCAGSSYAEQIDLRVQLCRPAWEWAPYFQDAIHDAQVAKGVDSNLIDTSNQLVSFGRGFRAGTTGAIKVLDTTVIDERVTFRGLLGQTIRDAKPPSDTILLQGPGIERTFKAFNGATGRRIELFREVRAIGLAQRLVSDKPEIRIKKETLAKVPFSGIFGLQGKQQLAGNDPPDDPDDPDDGGPEEPPVLVPLPTPVWLGGLGLVMAGIFSRRFR